MIIIKDLCNDSRIVNWIKEYNDIYNKNNITIDYFLYSELDRFSMIKFIEQVQHVLNDKN